MAQKTGRRHRRSQEIVKALTYQLDTCREEADLEAMVVSDENGLCVASAGSPATCEEIAARLPMLGRRPEGWDGVLLSSKGGWQVLVKSFRVSGTELFACAVGRKDRAMEQPLARSIEGVTRILAA